MTKLSNQGRIRLLTTASAAVAAVALSAPAIAGDATITPTGTLPIADVTLNAHDVMNKIQQNMGNVSASVDTATVHSVDPTAGVSSASATVGTNSIKASATFVWQNAGKALVWAIVAFIVTIVGFCIFCVGIIATIPIALIGTAYTYKKLTGQPVAP